MAQKWLAREVTFCPVVDRVRYFALVLTVALAVLTLWGCQREGGIGEDRRSREQITRRKGETSYHDSAMAENSSDNRQGAAPFFGSGAGDPEKVYRVDIKISNALSKESARHKKRTEWFKPGSPQIDRVKPAKKKGEPPQSERIQTMMPTRRRVEEFVGDKLIATYLSDAGDKNWKLYHEDGKLMAEASGAASIYDRFLGNLNLISETPDTFTRETRDGKSILKYVSREFGSCPILTIEVLSKENDPREIEEAEVSVVHGSEELYSMSLKVDRSPGELEDSLFELPDSAIIDEGHIYLNEIESKATRMLTENDSEGLAAIVSELESSSERFEGDIKYYTMLWQFSLAAGQFDKAFKYLERTNKIKPDEAIFNKIATLMMYNPEQAKNDDDLIADLREKCARVDKHDMPGLLGCANMLKLVGLVEEGADFCEAAAYAKPYDFVLLGDSYQYFKGSTQQILNECGQIKK